MYARIFVFIGAIVSTVALAACSNTSEQIEMIAEQSASHAIQ